MALRGVTLNQLRVFTAKLEAEGHASRVLNGTFPHERAPN